MASSLDGISYANNFAPKQVVAPNYLADFQQGYGAVQQIFEDQIRRKQQEQALALQQQRLQQEQAQAPYEIAALKDAATIRGNQITRIPVINANQDVQFRRNKAEADFYDVTHPAGGFPDLDRSSVQPLPVGSSPAQSGGLFGNVDNVRQTTYYPGETHSDPDTDAGRTSTGAPILFASPDMAGTAAVDPNKIPYGSVITRADGTKYVASDTGGAVKSMTASQGKAPVIDFASKGFNVPDYGGVTITPPTADYLHLSPEAKLAYHRNAVRGSGVLAPSSPVQVQSPIVSGIAPVQPGQSIALTGDGIPTTTEQATPVGALSGTIPQRRFGYDDPRTGQFVPLKGPDDIAQVPAGVTPGYRTRYVPSPQQAKNDAQLLASLRRAGASSDYPLDEYGALSRDDRTAANAALVAAKRVDASDPLYDPDTIETMAQIRVIDPSDPRGKIQGMGPRAANARAQLDAKSSEILRSTGKTGAEAVVDYTGTSAAKKTIALQEKQKAAISSFEKTARDNAQIALDLIDKGAAGGIGIPVFNRWLQAGRKATGDADVAAFNTAIGAFTNEYAKIISGNTGAAGASEGARREANELINRGGTPEQLKAQIQVAFQEMENRTKSIDEQINRLNQSILNKEKPKESTTKQVSSSADSAPVGAIATQGGKRYQKQTDGTWKSL